MMELSRNKFIQHCLSYLFCVSNVKNSAYFIISYILAVRNDFPEVESSDVAGVTRACSNLQFTLNYTAICRG